MTASTLQSFFPRACLEGERKVEKDRVKLANNKLILCQIYSPLVPPLPLNSNRPLVLC